MVLTLSGIYSIRVTECIYPGFWKVGFVCMISPKNVTHFFLFFFLFFKKLFIKVAHFSMITGFLVSPLVKGT